MVLRLTAEAAEIPEETKILKASMTVEYDFIDVAGRAHLLPVRAEAEMSRSHAVTRNVVSFVGYRKFSADAIIDFHDPENKKK